MSEQDEPYRVVQDEQGTWRILFTWHPELANFGPDDDLPDSHPAVTIVTEGAFLALMKEAVVQGYKTVYDVSNVPDEDVNIEYMQEELGKLKSENERLQEELSESNNFKQSEKANLAQAKLALMEKAMALGRTETDIFQSISRIGGNLDV